MRFWIAICILLYTLHVGYLTFWSWDYTYNMIANVVVGIMFWIMPTTTFAIIL
jgi:hypothetical protein